ncbi:MAG: hypothetical protein KDA77_14260 [Planctomycetaceae bacterium]|nr:hypothetical protein [Planctomycetaceae bacterium]
MNQQELDQAVAVATGEDLRAIRQRGFSLADPLEVNFDPEPDNRPPQIVDWEMRELENNVSLFAQQHASVSRES